MQGNQPTRQQDITAIWDGEPAAAAQGLQTNQHGGRVEQRRLWVSDLVVGYSDWPHRAQVCKMERIVRKKNATRREVAYAVTSLPPEAAGPDRLLALWRGHWGIENRVHWYGTLPLMKTAPMMKTAPKCARAPHLRSWRPCAMWPSV